MLKEFSDVSKEFQDKSPLTCDTQPEIKSDSEEFIYHPDIDSDFDKDVDDDFTDGQVDKELSDNIVESSIFIFSKITPVITELIDVFSKDVIHNGISQTPFSYLSIVSTALSQKENKNCRVIVDNRSCTNSLGYSKTMEFSH